MNQRDRALLRANEIRLERARLRRGIAALPMEEGVQRLADLLQEPPAVILSMQASEILKWPKRFGAVRANRLWQRLNTTPGKHVGELTDRQRLLLVELLRRG